MSEEKRMTATSSKLQAKDFITLGIFTVLFFVVVMVCVFASAVTVVSYAFAPAIAAIPGGVIYMLMRAKVPKTGGILLSGVFYHPLHHSGLSCIGTTGHRSGHRLRMDGVGRDHRQYPVIFSGYFQFPPGSIWNAVRIEGSFCGSHYEDPAGVSSDNRQRTASQDHG